MRNEILSLIPSALTIFFIIYGIFGFISEIFTTIFPIGIFLTGLLVLLIYIFRVPAPTTEQVEAIVGKDLFDEPEDGYILKTVAHRGAGLDAPENTLEAFQMCKTGGCDFIEFDVSLTHDAQPVVFHDSTLERMVDSNLVISNTNWEILKDIDLSVKHPYRDRIGATFIPTLDQTITSLLNSGQKMFIDIKDNNTKMVPIILELFVQFPELYSKAIVTSFFPNIIYLIRRKDPKIVCSLAYRPSGFANEYYKYPEGKGPQRSNILWKHYCLLLLDLLHSWALPRITYYMLGLSVILIHKDCLSGEAVLNWRNKGVRPIVWTVNTPTEKQYVTRVLKLTYLTDTLTGENTIHNS
ncbi:glycerophosphodiester phosphodiesterase 1 [Rhynchophorus ferrugineus]|uniref:GP-PDE domain-containing protein n=1 Tax=Rhynchophorus ferrugineus TaxID=354439 RepID=A0A834M113_RHYFE|nr:hypothetical protein GWI33_019835 [Rhynchophorus ferrugineus]